MEKPKPKEEPAPNKKTLLVRRWSAITSASNLKRKKRESFIYNANEDSLNSSKANYVRVSKTEYEEIKNRVSAIEKRLSLELESAESTVVHNRVDIIHDIQSAYEKTLGQSQQMSPGTDQLARRLSRELRIRTSDQKIIRSPSARKIGNIRRRSRESERSTKLVRNPSLQQIKNELRSSNLTRSVSSPVKSNISINTNIFTNPFSLNANTQISISSSGNSFDSSSSTYRYDHESGSRQRNNSSSSSNLSNDKSSPRRSRERRIPRRNAIVTPKRTHLRQRYYDFDGHRLIEVTGVECDKENGFSGDTQRSTPNVVPHIKRAIPVTRTPKKLCITPKGNRNTPLRVLPSTNYTLAGM